MVSQRICERWYSFVLAVSRGKRQAVSLKCELGSMRCEVIELDLISLIVLASMKKYLISVIYPNFALIGAAQVEIQVLNGGSQVQ